MQRRRFTDPSGRRLLLTTAGRRSTGGKQVAQNAQTVEPAGCTGPIDPYRNYASPDAYLGDDVTIRFYNDYRLEGGEAGPPNDPNAPPQRRDDWPDTPESVPPMPFTEWPTGAVTSIGVTRPNSVDGPLAVAIANTSVSQWLQDNNFHIYGWVEPGINISSNTTGPGGNFPISDS